MVSFHQVIFSSCLSLLFPRLGLSGFLRPGTDGIDRAISSDEPKSASSVLENQNDTLREFFENAVLTLPNDVEASEDLGVFGMFYMNITQFRCFDLSFGSVILSNSTDEKLEDYIQVEIKDFVFQCQFNLSWSYGFAQGEGAVVVDSDKNYLTTKKSANISIIEQEDEEYTDSCDGMEIDIATLEFEGDMTLRILNIARGFIRRIAEKELEDVFCQLMSQEVLGRVLYSVSDGIANYTSTLNQSMTDPLFMEANGVQGGAIIDLQDDEENSDISNQIIDMVLTKLNNMYAVKTYDPSANTENQMDYGVNTLFRKHVLDNDAALPLSAGIIGDSFSTETPLVDIDMKIHSVKIHGLDMVTYVSPVSIIGHSTLQSVLFWESLSIQINATFETHASSSQDSFLQNGDELKPITENVLILARADGINATISVMVPLVETELESLPMGYLLGMMPLPGCIPPLLSDIAISGLDVTISKLHIPEFQGINSQVIEDATKNATDIGLRTFEKPLLEAVPTFFQKDVREMLNGLKVEYYCQASQRYLSARELGEEPLVGSEPIGELVEDREFYFNLIFAIICVCTAALAAGLTMGLLSLDPLVLLIKQRAGASEQEKKDAASLLPIVKQHHLLLVSLLLMNASANEALPLFLDKLVPGYIAVILSVTLVLFFGEIIPSAVFTGPDQIRIASRLAPVVRFVMLILSPIAYPIAKVLDIVLHDEEESDNLYNRGELSALVRIQYEERLASKRRRRSQLRHAFSDEGSGISEDSYSSRRTSGSSVRPEIKATIRGIKRELSQRNVLAHNDLHIDEVMFVEGALQMRTTAATKVFTPWNRVFSIPHDMKLGERNIVKIYRSGFSRIPVYEKNPDDPDDNTRIRGILSSRQLMVVDSANQRPVSTLPIATPRCIAPETTLVDLINMFQTGGVQGSHLALVCARPKEGNAALKNGEYLPDSAGLMGIVTLEDVLENLIQEQIYDEYDRHEREHLRLAKWGVQRWKMYVKRKKRQQGGGSRGSSYQSLPENPRMLDVVEEATQQHIREEREESPPTERTSLLGRLNIFRSKK